MKKDFVELFEKYNKDETYIVKDIISSEKNKIVFILESPHNEEIINRYPVAGKSGIDMADFIKIGDGKRSLGEIVKLDDSLGISILNICKVPLQPTYKLDVEYKELVDNLDKTIRNGYKNFGNHVKDKEFNDIEKLILDDFSTRYNKMVLDKETLIVVCGEFAKAYFDKIKSPKSKVVYVPHPSRNQWKKNSNGLLELKSIIDLLNTDV